MLVKQSEIFQERKNDRKHLFVDTGCDETELVEERKALFDQNGKIY